MFPQKCYVKELIKVHFVKAAEVRSCYCTVASTTVEHGKGLMKGIIGTIININSIVSTLRAH